MLPNQTVSIYSFNISRKQHIAPKAPSWKTPGIGTNVSVMILVAKGNQVKIGIHALKYLSTHREEIYIRIKNEQKVDI
ncbi:carbon storage regulator [Microbulbifer sp. JTAC008]|uniref:carbon storage regulator n=1 Tax=Microbulbifer sp. JTAC008 TaxID=3243374 RepID=UPI00403A4990